MIKNYFKIAWRNLWKYKVFSLINIFGLAVAMSVCMLMILMFSDQLSYDKFHSKKDRIYRLVTTPLNQTKLRASIPIPVTDELATNYPAIESAVSLRRGFGGDIIYQNEAAELKGYFSTPDFLKVFDYSLEKGDMNSALDKPSSLVISHKIAKKLFGNENAIGKTVNLSDRGLNEWTDEGTEAVDWGLFTITGVFSELNQKSHLVFDVIISSATLPLLQATGKMEDLANNWDNDGSAYAYALLKPSASEKDLSVALEKITAAHFKDSKDENLQNSKLTFQHLTDITPGPVVNNAPSQSLPLFVYYILGGLVLVILIASCLNYTSLSVARSVTRSGEIGLRKVVGAFRKDLILQFLCETLLTVFLSSVMAFGFLFILKAAFLNLWINQTLNFDLNFNVYVYLAFVAFTFFIGIISGIYPAIKFSKARPILLIKKMSSPHLGKWGVRRVLTVSQFSISLILIITSLVIYNQFKHYQKFDYGFDPTNVVNVNLQGHDFQLIKNAFNNMPGVEIVGGCAYLPGTGRQDGLELKVPGKDISYKAIDLSVDDDFVKVMDIPLLYGNNLPNQNNTDGSSILVNETAVKEFGFKQPAEIIGQTYLLNGKEVRVVGVIKDITFFLLFSGRSTGPIVLHTQANSIKYATLKIEKGDIEPLMKSLASKWKSIDPIHPLEYEFYSETLANTNKGIFDLVSVIGFLAFLAIIIACLGLLGMAIYTTERRTKEIGIRKVLGASEWTLNFLLSKEFLIMISIAIFIASPLAILFNNYWLNFMVIREDLSIGTVFFGCIVLILLGLLAVVPQTMKISRNNPIKSLKTE